MNLITKKDLISTAAQRYAAAFQRRDEWPTDRDYTQEKQIHSQLEKLPPTAPEVQITSIVGHNRLTRNTCHQCGRDSDTTVAFGHEKHHMLDVKAVCPSCLEEAVGLLRNEI